ncbi:hypothetical protein M569_16309 [Genlisea aurea]|uniref:Uncharacterized protein n=1 Tax=Genlisea aurea TaxID=192259 RepID=S8BV97_9LAMI|nr:hypothetical protein M569_16309 [Genlisea aurea]
MAHYAPNVGPPRSKRDLYALSYNPAKGSKLYFTRPIDLPTALTLGRSDELIDPSIRQKEDSKSCLGLHPPWDPNARHLQRKPDGSDLASMMPAAFCVSLLPTSRQRRFWAGDTRTAPEPASDRASRLRRFSEGRTPLIEFVVGMDSRLAFFARLSLSTASILGWSRTPDRFRCPPRLSDEFSPDQVRQLHRLLGELMQGTRNMRG